MPQIILSDFSKTFTDASCPSTWSVIIKSGLLWEAYAADRNALYEANIHFEKEGNVPETQRWFHEHADLFVKYGLSQEQINQVVWDDRYFKPRNGIVEFLKKAREKHILIKIVTSGITNFVRAFFIERGFGLDGIEVYGNELFMEGGRVVGVDRSKGMIPMSKASHPFKTYGFDTVIIVGDAIEDLNVCKGKNIVSYGFCDTTDAYTHVLTKEGSMEAIVL